MAGFSFGSKRSSSWDVARGRFSKAAATMQGRQRLAVRRAALTTEAAIKRGLKSGSPGGKPLRPLSEITKLLRQGDSPLLDRGALLGSIKTTVSSDGREAFVGVHRGAKGRDGTSIVNVAVAHEFGTKPYVIPVTQALRKFFMRLHIISGGRISPLSPSKTEILHPGVPARPFIRPVVESIRGSLQGVVIDTVAGSGGPI